MNLFRFPYSQLKPSAAGVTAIATIAIAMGSIFAVTSQNNQSRIALGVDLVLRLDDRFNSAQFRQLRRNAASSLLKKSSAPPDEVLDFFETIGMLVRRGVLDEEVVWHTFFYWVNGYWYAAHDYIKSKNDPTFYEDMRYLHERLVALEKHKYNSPESEIQPSEPELKDFLIEESNLQ